MHVLILGARAPAALEWARACHTAGWRVTAADSLAWPITRMSRAVDRYVRLPEPRRNPKNWLSVLARIVHEEAVDIVLPTCEEVFYLAYGREQLTCRVVTSDFSILRKLHNKLDFAEMTIGWPVQAPSSRLIETRAAALALTEEASEWVFKPVYSRFGKRTLVRPHADALAQLQPNPARPWVAQRFVNGREHCSYSLLVDGQVTAHACYHPRYRVGRGAGIWFEPTDPTPIRAFLTHFGKVTGYTGQVGFDFIECSNGQYYVLECNPRATSGAHLFADRPQQLVAALSDITGGTLVEGSRKPHMVALAMLMFAAPRYGLRRDFWRAFASAQDVIGRRSDPAPLVAQAVSVLEIAVRALIRRCGLITAATADIEWDGQPLEDTP